MLAAINPTLLLSTSALLVATASSPAFAQDQCSSVYMARRERLQRLLVHPTGVMEVGTAAVGAGFGGFVAAPVGQAAAIGAGAGIGAVAGVAAFTAGVLGRARRLEDLAHVIELAEDGGSRLDEEDRADARRALRRLTRRANRRSAVDGTAEDVLRILRETIRSGALCGRGQVMGLGKMSRFVARHLEGEATP